MKIPLVAFTLAIAGLSATPADPPPATKFEARGAARKVIVMPPLELNPHLAPNLPVQFKALRETSASASGARLNRLDDRVTHLKARADLTAKRTDPGQDFEHLMLLRAKVVTALRNLRNPNLGLDAAESAVSNALNELELAIEGLDRKFDQVEQREPLRVS